MPRKKSLKGSIRPGALWCLYFIAAVFLLAASCGSDETAPEDPSTSSVIPDTVFFNTGSASPKVLFEGRANDNFRVQTVQISFDNGTVWNAASLDSTPPNSIRSVQWSYLASESEMSPMNTVLIRAVDGDDNEVVSSPIMVSRQTGSTIASLTSVFAAAAPGDVIALSSGSGGAYGGGIAALHIPVDVPMTVLGAGVGDTDTSGGIPSPSDDPTATILQAGTGTASVFSVDDDLALSKLRIIGGQTGVRIFDSAAGGPQLSIEKCLFDQQTDWAVWVSDDDESVTVQVLSSTVDASTADSSSRGGLYLENVLYQIEDDSKFYYQTDPGGPGNSDVKGAAIQVAGGSGTITESIFGGNALAIWASGGSPLITSCSISGAAYTTYGINLTGGPSSPVIRGNTISGNSGYGIRIGNSVTPKLRRCVITGNGLSGIFIDFGSSSGITDIDLGTTSEGGYNDLFENTHPGVAPHPDTVEIFVASGSGNFTDLIPAERNYWGVNVSGLIPSRIYDGVDAGNRARLTYNPPYLFPQN